jgi:hypothetical protein
VGKHLFCDKLIVSGKEDFGHGIAFVAVIFEIVLGAKVVKAIGSGNVWFDIGRGAVLLDDGISLLYKFEIDVTAGFYDISDLFGKGGFQQGHD